MTGHISEGLVCVRRSLTPLWTRSAVVRCSFRSLRTYPLHRGKSLTEVPRFGLLVMSGFSLCQFL